MIAFVQPFGLGDGAGGARILRALLKDAGFDFLSICTSPRRWRPAPFGSEIHLPLRPHFGRLEGTRVANYLAYLDPVLANRFESKLEKKCRESGVQAIHAIPHGLSFWQAFNVARRMEIPYYLNVHDDMPYNIGDRPYLQDAMEKLAYVWPRAHGRIVISEAMGKEYCRRYGDMPYEIITDGLNSEIKSDPRPWNTDDFRVYFMGALHLSYHTNLKVLLGGLKLLKRAQDSTNITFTIRGSELPFEVKGLEIHEKPFASEEIVAKDFENVDLLYLPLPFGEEFASFARFSLSTKMVTYLGTGLPILYHGPEDAAAARLLKKHNAAFFLHDQTPSKVANTLTEMRKRRGQVVRNALTLARDRFLLEDQRRRFSAMICNK